MASWLTHLRVAERIKQKVSEIDFQYLIIGSIAPDSGVPDESRMDYTPSKDITHCKYQNDSCIADMNETVFFDSYLVPEKIMIRSDNTRSFLWGYYFHLITDKLWLEECFRPFQKSYENEFQNPDKDFVNLIREEMFSLDFEYIKEKGPMLINELNNFDGSINFFYEFDSDYIYECKNRIVEFYSAKPLTLDREYKYLNSQIIEEFIAKAADKCISILIV